MAGGAEAGGKDVAFAKAGGEELGAICFGEIEVNVFGRGLMARRHHVEPLKRIGFFAGAGFVEIVGGVGELGRELNDEFCADFVTAGTDGWADGSKEIGRIRMETGVEFADGFFEDAGEGAAPSGVDGGDGAFFGIDEKDGDAVGGLHAEEEAWSVGERGVAFAGFFWSGSERPDDCGVDLFEDDERKFWDAEGGLEFFAIFDDVFASVPFGQAEVEDALAIEMGDAAGSGAEAVEKPGEFLEGVELENL